MNRVEAWIRDRLQAMRPTMNGYLLPLVKHFESFFPTWYKCSSGVATIGYGHTGSVMGLDAAPWTEEYASWVLQRELDALYIPATIEALAKAGIDYSLLSAAQQAAIVSACYNSGPGIISNGTWVRLFRSGASRIEVQNAFYKWNKSAGKISPGLVRRRFAEMKLFWEGKLDYDPDGWKDYYDSHR